MWRFTGYFTSSNTSLKNSDGLAIDMDVIETDDKGSEKYALIFGGKGALGSKVIFELKAQDWWVASADYSMNTHADMNILLMQDLTHLQQEASIINALHSALPNKKLKFIFCIPNSLKCGNASQDFVQKSEQLLNELVLPASICASISSEYLKKDGLLLFTTYMAANKPTANMIAYSMAVNALIHMAKCLALPKSGFPEHAKVVCLLPSLLETTTCRRMNPHTDCGKYTPLKYVSDMILRWCSNKEQPVNGAHYVLSTNKFNTECKYYV